jgi:hypothetical protein
MARDSLRGFFVVWRPKIGARKRLQQKARRFARADIAPEKFATVRGVILRSEIIFALGKKYDGSWICPPLRDYFCVRSRNQFF